MVLQIEKSWPRRLLPIAAMPVLHIGFPGKPVSLQPEPPDPITGMEARISAATRRNGGVRASPLMS